MGISDVMRENKLQIEPILIVFIGIPGTAHIPTYQVRYSI